MAIRKTIVSAMALIMVFSGFHVFADDIVTDEKLKISIGYCPFGMMETPVAKVKEFYKKYLPNVEVEWVFGVYSIELINKWLTGELEIAYLGDMPAVVLQNRLGNTKWVSVAVYPHGEVAAIYIPHDSKIKSVKDLNDEYVATGMGSSHHRILNVIAKAEGININIKNLKPADALERLEKGKIKAFCYWPPYVEMVKHKNAGKVLIANCVKYEPEVNAVWPLVVSEKFANEHPLIVKGLVRADRDLHKFMKENPDEAADIVYNELEEKIPFDVVKASLDSYRYPDGFKQEHIDTMQRGIDFLKEKKFIKKGFNAAEWADTGFAE